jgi:hypothetical protein
MREPRLVMAMIGNLWHSEATFIADREGAIDLTN